MVEALGVGLPENAAIPAVDARRNHLARMAGRRIVEMVHEDLGAVQDPDARGVRERDPHARALSAARPMPSFICSPSPAGSASNSTLDDFDQLGRDVHCLVDLMPSGRFLMEDFYYAGGLPVVLRALGERGLLHKDAPTVNGKPIWENVKDAPCWNREVITPFEAPFKPDSGMAILRGNISPRRGGDQAVGRLAGADEAHRPGRGVRDRRGAAPRGRGRKPRHRRDLHHGAEELRPEGLSGHGRGRQHADPAQAAASRVCAT